MSHFNEDMENAAKRASYQMVLELQNAKEAFQDLYNQTLDFTCIMSPCGKIFGGNYAAAKWLRVDHDLLHRSHLGQVFSEDEWRIFQNTISSFDFKSSETLELLSKVFIDGDVRDVSWSIRRLESASTERGVIVQALGRDVTVTLAIGQKSARLELELETAHLIQKKFIPLAEILEPHYSISSFYHPAEQCSGDWWGCFALEEGKVLVCVADVMGHGTASALITSMTYASCASFARRRKKGESLSIGYLFSEISAVIFESFQGHLNLTCFGMILDTLDGSFSASNASHHFPIILPKSGPYKKVGNFSLQSFPVGHCREHRFIEYEGKLEDGDRLVMFTDGLIECRNHDGAQYGARSLLKSLMEHRDKTCSILRDNVVKDAFKFYEGKDLSDDITLVILRYDNKGTGVV